MKASVFAFLVLFGINAHALEVESAGVGVNGNLYVRVAHDAGSHQRSLDLKDVVCRLDEKECEAVLDTSNFVEDCTGSVGGIETHEIDTAKHHLYGPQFAGTKLTVEYGKNRFGFTKKFTVKLIGERAGYE